MSKHPIHTTSAGAPIAAVDVSRIQPKLTLAELRQPFLDRIEKAIYSDPF